MADDKAPLQPLADTLKVIEDTLAFFPEGVAKHSRHRLATLRQLVLEQKPPSVLVMGRRGAGKSSLINALFGQQVARVGHLTAQTAEGVWFEHKTELGSVSLLDTRGLAEGSTPEGAKTSDALKALLVEVRKKAPDLVLFVAKASELDAAIDADIDALERVLVEIEHVHKAKPKVMGVVTHCDLLEPLEVKLHDAASFDATDVLEKQARLGEAERLLLTKLRGKGGVGAHLSGVVGVSSYLSFRADGALRSDGRHRIDVLSEQLFKALPDSSRAVFARMAQARKVQLELASDLAHATAALCAVAAAMPIPVADVVPITTLQVGMVIGIAWLGGRKLDVRAAGEFLAGLGAHVGAAFAMRELSRALSKVVFPGAGVAVSSSVAFVATLAIGAAAKAYFIEGATLAEAKGVYADTSEKGDTSEKPEV